MKWLLWKEGIADSVCARAPTAPSAASHCSWELFSSVRHCHSLCILLPKGAWPHAQHLPSSLASSLWYFKFEIFFFFPLKIPWVNILCRTCWHFFWSKFPWCFVEESGIFLYSDSFKIKDGLSGLAGLQTQFDPNPLFFPNFSSLFYCLCIFYCSSTSELEDFWECFMQSLVAPAVTGPKRKSWRPKISFCDILWGYFANYIKNSWARSGFGNFILTVLSYFFQNF